MGKDEDWKKKLSKEQYHVLREKGTEGAFSGRQLLYNKRDGTYVCAGCGNELFDSDTKFDSGTGWPSFYDAIEGAVKFEEDRSLDAKRIEVLCAGCDGHLGHVFDDGPREKTGKRYCINSVSLEFKEKE